MKTKILTIVSILLMISSCIKDPFTSHKKYIELSLSNGTSSAIRFYDKVDLELDSVLLDTITIPAGKTYSRLYSYKNSPIPDTWQDFIKNHCEVFYLRKNNQIILDGKGITTTFNYKEEYRPDAQYTYANIKLDSIFQ